MMVILIDANALVSHARLKDAIWERMRTAISRGTLRVVVPRIAVVEAQARVRASSAALAETVRRSAVQASPEAKAHIQQGVDLIRSDAETYELGPQLEALGVKLLPTERVSHDELADRAVGRVRPFDSSGGGYRDTLHWFSFMEQLSAGPAHSYVLVSNDNIFYAGTKGPEMLEAHADLIEEARGRLGVNADASVNVTFARNLGEVTVPGQYVGDPFEPELDEHFASQVANIERGLGGALYTPPKAFGLHDWDVTEPGSVSDAELVSAVGRKLDGTTDVEVQFDVRVRVGYDLTRYGTVEGEPFPEVERDFEERVVRLTGKALIPEAGSQHLTLSGAEARPDDLAQSTAGPDADPFVRLKTPSARSSLWSQIWLDTQRNVALLTIENVGDRAVKDLDPGKIARGAAASSWLAANNVSYDAMMREARRAGTHDPFFTLAVEPKMSAQSLAEAQRAATDGVGKGSADAMAAAQRAATDGVGDTLRIFLRDEAAKGAQSGEPEGPDEDTA
ncbi:PIN domain-containing protein [Frigoribacterium sp. SL97]|uniref:PIN domain-containing protein n=1 Tax=Frigoribacterium sp. SL97 TaxID=2994664 RepID=UPI00226FC226|nr:PIN domain-containing protein [Frigoribacterium sp. SL97]WAC50544.1 PIN domain-containing protein [Frigoribacterium sp. SL97]